MSPQPPPQLMYHKKKKKDRSDIEKRGYNCYNQIQPITSECIVQIM